MKTFKEFLSESKGSGDITSKIKAIMDLEQKSGNQFRWTYKKFSFEKENGKDVLIADVTPSRGEDSYDDFIDFDSVSWTDALKSKEFKKFLEDNGYKPKNSYSKDSIKTVSGSKVVIYI